MMSPIHTKSISQLEGWEWKDEIPTEEDSFVVRNFYRLHNLPIKEYSLEDLRFMIGQEDGLAYLVPVALIKLQENIFLEAEFYEGDLLYTLLTISSNYWHTHKKEKQELIKLYTDQKTKVEEVESTYEIKNKIKTAFTEFSR